MTTDEDEKIRGYLDRFRTKIIPTFSFLKRYGFSGPSCTVTPYGYYAVYRSEKVWLCVAVEHRDGGLNVKLGRVDAAIQRRAEEERAGEPYLFPAVYMDFLKLLYTRARDVADRIVVLIREITDREKQLEAQRLVAQALQDHCEDVLRGEVLFGL